MNAQGQLPNQQVTWGARSASIEEFTDWQQRTAGKYASEDTELLAYLSDQLKIEGAPLIGIQLNHPVLGLLSYMNESNNRMQELLFAYLAIVVSGDSQPSKKLIAGQRLTGGLHPDYVASTHCYGTVPQNYWVDAATNLRTVLGADFDLYAHTAENLQVMAGQSFADMSAINFQAVLATLQMREGQTARLKEIYANADIDPDTILSNTTTRIFLPTQHGEADYASMSLTDVEFKKIKGTIGD